MKRKAFLFLFSFLFLKISAQLCTNELPVSFYSTIDEQEIVERKCMPDLDMTSKEGTCQFTISESEEAISSFYTTLDMSSEWRLTVVRSDTGRTVYDSSVSGTSKTVGTTGWSPGIYIAVAQVDGQYVSSKFVVSK